MKLQRGFFARVADLFIAKAILALLIVLPAAISVLGQNEANNWYFGFNAGLSFTTGTPVALTGSGMATHEGCAAMSDQAGNLLFYTSGKNVWDKNHGIVTNGNGLFGSPSATQSAIIVPWPGTGCKKYFIFTVPGHEDDVVLSLPPSLHYSVVEFNALNPLGVITTKNAFLKNPVSEKLTAVVDGAGTGFWVVAHGFDKGNASNAVNSEFYAYHITASGLNTTAATSSQGSAHVAQGTAPGGAAAGQMKISPDGTRIACGVWSRFAEVLSFNTTTGAVTGPVTTINATVSPFQTSYVYGIEFSPNSKLLYVSTSGSYPNDVIQFDLTTTTPTPTVLAIPNPVALANYDTASLQLGPDKKIYVARVNGQSLSVINFPDIAGQGCNLTAGPTFSTTTTVISRLGLPTIISGNFSCSPTPTPTPTPTPQDCCDRLAAVPYSQPNLSLDYRTFTFTNLKAPVSPICSIDIALNPAPPYKQGGDLYIDGNLIPTGSRFISPYNRVPNAGALNISAVNTVRFNLGIDYTLNPPWVGTITFTVNHCDNSTCTLTYGPWIASPPSPPSGPNVYVSTERVEGNFLVLNFQLKPRARRKQLKWISFMLADGKGQIFAAKQSPASEGRERPAPIVIQADEPQSRGSVLYAFTQPLKLDEASGTFQLVVARDAGATGAPSVVWTTYDANGNAVERGTITSRRAAPRKPR